MLLNCSGSEAPAGGFSTESASSGGASSGSTPGASSSGFGGEVPDAGAGAGCSEEAKLVYVLSREKDLYSFKPDTLTFARIGTLGCAAGTATPNSMAVDRSGTAWVNYNDGSLWKVSTKDASCTSTTLPHSLGRFGMAFSSNGVGSSEETLYVMDMADDILPFDDKDGRGLYTIDLKAMSISPVGDFSGSLAQQGAELTGTGDGKLFGFFTTRPASLAEIQKSNAATPSPRSLSSVDTGTAWAFSFWGGDFWLYTATGVGSSDVTRVKASSDNSISVVKRQVGFGIVGAGVSTCAPLAPPK